MNVIVVGALVKAMGLNDIDWEDVIRTTVKPKFIDINIKALKLGMEQVAGTSAKQENKEVC
jgi:indolepyruvate ferredoxin oxidoreductase beta subunit